MVWKVAGSLMDTRAAGVFNNASSGLGLDIQFVSTVDAWASPNNNGVRSSMTLSGDTVTQQTSDMTTAIALLNNVPGTGVWSYRRWTRTFSLTTGAQIGEASADHSHLLNLNAGNTIHIQNTNDLQFVTQANSEWRDAGILGNNPITQTAPGNSFFAGGAFGWNSSGSLIGGDVYVANGDHVVGPSLISRYSPGIAAVQASQVMSASLVIAAFHGIAGHDGDQDKIYGWRKGDAAGAGAQYEVLEFNHAMTATLSTNVLPNPASVRQIDPIRIFQGRYICDGINGAPMQVYDANAANALVGTIGVTGNATSVSIPIAGRYLYFPAVREIWQILG